jgi:hypothetical protein
MTAEDLCEGVKKTLDELNFVLDSLNDLEDEAWDEVMERDVVLALIDAQGKLSEAARLLAGATVRRQVEAMRNAR